MPEKKDDKRELATNRLLEILRGDTEEALAEKVDERLGLSEEEQSAFTDKIDRPGTAPFKEEEPGKPSFVSSFIENIREKSRQLFRPQKGYIGIDIGMDSIKYVYMLKQKYRYVLKDMGMRKVEEHYTGDPQKKIENIKKAVNELIASNIKKTSRISTSVFGPNVSIRKISLPKLAKKEMKDAILWNAKKELPFPAENAMIDYKYLGTVEEKGVEKAEVLVGVVENTLIDEKLEFLNSVSIEPAKISAVPLCIYNNFLHYFGDPEQANGVVIDIGAKTSHIVFVQDGTLQFAREINTAGDDITQGLMGMLSGTDGVVKIDKEEAERLKFVYGFPANDVINTTEHGIHLSQIASMMRPTLERLLVQIQRSFDYYRTKFPFDEPEKVYLTGGTALLKNLIGFLAEGLNKEIEVLDPLKNIEVEQGLEEEKNVSAVAPALAVAIGGVVSDKKDINLLPQILKEKLLFDVQKNIVAAAAAVVFLIMLILSYFSATELGDAKDEYNAVLLNKQPMDALNNQYTVLETNYRTIQNEQNQEYQQYIEFAGAVKLPDYLLLLSTVHPGNPRYVIIDEIDIDLDQSNSMVLTGRIISDRNESQLYLVEYQYFLTL